MLPRCCRRFLRWNCRRRAYRPAFCRCCGRIFSVRRQSDPGEAGFRIPLSSAAVSAAVVSADRRGHRRLVRNWKDLSRHAARAADGGAAAFCILSVSFAAPLVQCAAAAPVLHTARRGRSFRPGGGWRSGVVHLAADAFSGDYRRFARGGKSGGDSALVSVCPFKPPLLLLVGLPVAGVLTLCVMMFDSRSDGMLERLTGMPFRFGAPLLGGAILTVALFDWCCPLLRSTGVKNRFTGSSGRVRASLRRGFLLGGEGAGETAFLPRFCRTGCRFRSGFRSEKGRSTPVDSEAEFRARLARLSAFLTRNAGVPVAVMAGCRSESAESFARAVRELRLPIDLRIRTTRKPPTRL